ncbi:uncharacterized protein LOC106011980 [Aplysia californica]|uniref:Uncharacterized protein LOC106011980 n=1 Tax=Aplysia californica TaxID=6500 RepID=A0ABM1A1F3_APLCA|nr:uncharacterized protein LOC106011980 [Aplysia californica]
MANFFNMKALLVVISLFLRVSLCQYFGMMHGPVGMMGHMPLFGSGGNFLGLDDYDRKDYDGSIRLTCSKKKTHRGKTTDAITVTISQYNDFDYNYNGFGGGYGGMYPGYGGFHGPQGMHVSSAIGLTR